MPSESSSSRASVIEDLSAHTNVLMYVLLFHLLLIFDTHTLRPRPHAMLHIDLTTCVSFLWLRVARSDGGRLDRPWNNIHGFIVILSSSSPRSLVLVFIFSL
jgi:hypothetical protein